MVPRRVLIQRLWRAMWRLLFAGRGREADKVNERWVAWCIRTCRPR